VLTYKAPNVRLGCVRPRGGFGQANPRTKKLGGQTLARKLHKAPSAADNGHWQAMLPVEIRSRVHHI
jgi:hypothetical protein